MIASILATTTPHSVLDLCCGTGAVSLRLVREMNKRQLPPPALVCADFSENMLEEAEKRFHQRGIFPKFLLADVLSLPLADNSFDTIAVAFGIRNLNDHQRALNEIYRLLQPQGTVVILELTPPQTPCVRTLYSWYMTKVAPLLGLMATRHISPYRYLTESIEHFSLPSLLTTLKNTGFSHISTDSLSFGIATIIQAIKQ